jgi:hypothetical protein
VAAPAKVCAEVAELADALHSGCSARQGVEVRVLSSAPGFGLSRYRYSPGRLISKKFPRRGLCLRRRCLWFHPRIQVGS